MNIALPLQQHPHFGTALRLLGRDVGTTDILGAAPIQTITRFGLRYAPRAPIWDAETTDDEKVRGLCRAGLRLVNCDRGSSAVMRSAGFRRIMTSAHVAELSLEGTPDDWLTRAHGKWRNIWRRAQNAPFRIKEQRFNPARHGWLLHADRAQQRTKGFRALPHDVIHAYAATSPGDVIVLTATQKGVNLAAMLLLVHAPVASYHLGWTSTEGRKHGAHHAMLMQTGKIMAKRGITRLDLGGVDTDGAPGLARFKIGSGATIRPLGGTWLRLPFL